MKRSFAIALANFLGSPLGLHPRESLDFQNIASAEFLPLLAAGHNASGTDYFLPDAVSQPSISATTPRDTSTRSAHATHPGSA